MVQGWAFTKAADLELLFEEGIIVCFDSDGISAGNLDDKWITKREDVRPRWKIRIDCRESVHRQCSQHCSPNSLPPWNTTFLDEQKETLLHEILHWWRAIKGLEPQKSRLVLSQSSYIKNEEIIDQVAYEIVKNQPDLLDSIVLELSMRRTCSFRYECATPFLRYHHDLIVRYLKGIKALVFGDERLIRLMQFMSSSQTP